MVSRLFHSICRAAKLELNGSFLWLDLDYANFSRLITLFIFFFYGFHFLFPFRFFCNFLILLFPPFLFFFFFFFFLHTNFSFIYIWKLRLGSYVSLKALFESLCVVVLVHCAYGFTWIIIFVRILRSDWTMRLHKNHMIYIYIYIF